MAFWRAGLSTAIAAIQLSQALGQGQWSFTPKGDLCTDYGLAIATSETECFDQARIAVGLTGKQTLAIGGLGFTGCVWNAEEDKVMYGVSSSISRISSIQQICKGVLTTTTTTTTTGSTTTTTTATATTVTITTLPGGQGVYTEIDIGKACVADFRVPDITSSTVCFGAARAYLGYPANKGTLAINGLGFTGCVHNILNNKLIYSETAGVVGGTSSVHKFICDGLATTTSTTSTVTTTITETTTTTITATTATLTTSTATETTTTTQTETFTTTITNTTTFTTTTTDAAQAAAAAAAAFVGEDPITIYNNQMRKFYLPEGELTLLFSTPELHLHAAAFTHGSEQWIKRIALTGPNGEPVMQVAIRDDIEAFIPDGRDPSLFATLDVTLDWLGGRALARVPDAGDYSYEWRTAHIAFSQLPDRKIGQAPAELVMVEGQSGTIVIASTEALGFEGEEAHLAVRNAHLDFIVQMRHRDACEGILPELWGSRPMSDRTLALLAPTE